MFWRSRSCHPASSTEDVGQNAWLSQSHLCAFFRLTAPTDTASITPRVFTAENGAFMTPKYCGSLSCVLGCPIRPLSDRYRRRVRSQGARRECGMPASGTSWSGPLWAGEVAFYLGRRVAGGGGEGAISGVASGGQLGHSPRFHEGLSCRNFVHVLYGIKSALFTLTAADYNNVPMSV
jgi:hypothetical protein